MFVLKKNSIIKNVMRAQEAIIIIENDMALRSIFKKFHLDNFANYTVLEIL